MARQKIKRDIVLALETGIGGGSISLFRQGREIGSLKGETRISRAEDLITQISDLLKRKDVSLKEIETIYVSKGPGGFTGLRIGIATAKGLQKSLNCECRGVNVLEAMLLKAASGGINLAAASSGREQQIWRQVFRVKTPFQILEKDAPRSITLKDLITEIKSGRVSGCFLEESVYEKIRGIIPNFDAGEKSKYIKVSEPLSKFIGLKGIRAAVCEEIFPVFY